MIKTFNNHRPSSLLTWEDKNPTVYSYKRNSNVERLRKITEKLKRKLNVS